MFRKYTVRNDRRSHILRESDSLQVSDQFFGYAILVQMVLFQDALLNPWHVSQSFVHVCACVANEKHYGQFSIICTCDARAKIRHIQFSIQKKVFKSIVSKQRLQTETTTPNRAQNCRESRSDHRAPRSRPHQFICATICSLMLLIDNDAHA